MSMGLMRKLGLVSVMVGALAVSAGCTTVPAGHRGIKVYLFGGDKGVNEKELGVGRYLYWPVSQEIYVFPVFQQNYVWSRHSAGQDKSITFQTREGLSVNADLGISYSVDEAKVSVLFQRYRRGLDEITDLFLRNMVRDALTSIASTMSIEDVYGERRQSMILEVEKKVQDQVRQHGIIVERIYSIGDFRLPPVVVSAINAKIEATQLAQQRENEVREARAVAAKLLVKTEGDAQSLRLQAQAEAEANALRAQALTPELIQYEAVMRWNGSLPTVISGTESPMWSGWGPQLQCVQPSGAPAPAPTQTQTQTPLKPAR